MKLKKFNLVDDIYYSIEYTSLYLKRGESLFLFDYQKGDDKFFNISIKRPINKIANEYIYDGYFDLETAYGYGGYYATTENRKFLENAFEAYKNKCNDENIIAEFIRFHPYNNIVNSQQSYFDLFALDRETVSIDLRLTNQERWSSYSATVRNLLRRLSNDISVIESTDINTFMILYQLTMDRNNADKLFYFDRTYFEKLLALQDVKLFAVVYNNIVVNMSFILFGRDLAHYHLSTNNAEFLKQNGNYYLLDAVCNYININYPGISEFHLGGGRTNDNLDSLLAFKSKFSNIKNKFYIAGKIFNQSIYCSYIDAAHKLNPEYINTSYFLKYRLFS